MFNPYRKQSDALEKFRITAHLRSYLKDPIILNDALLQDAVDELKKIPYDSKDPTDVIAIDFLLASYRAGYVRHEDLTEDGYKLVRAGKHRRHHAVKNENLHQKQLFKNRLLFT
ncbi:MAG: hypothetical protein IMF15_04125 [Proteobacteria bacterium]|nr:hypothetical protein [Pseudomonadota bacterium]